MIRIAPGILLDDTAIEVSFIQSGGPGGQNVNKVSTAAQLRFDPSTGGYDEAYLARLRLLAGQRMTTEGVVVITARRFRTQDRNREDAMERLVDLLRQAAHRPKSRRPTRPTKASKERRLTGKAVRGKTKRERQAPRDGDQ